MLTGNPFDDLLNLLADLPEADTCAAKKVRSALAAKPVEPQGALAESAEWLACWQGTAEPSVAQSHICLFASSYEGHGDPADVTGYVDATAKGAAPVNLLCVDKGIGLRAIQLAPELPHKPGKDWGEADCMAAVAFGMEATAAGGNLLALTDLAPGNAAHALAIILAAQTEAMADMLDGGEETDLDIAAAEILTAAFAGDGEATISPLEAMRRCGGREIAATVGAIVAARSRRLPVVAEGWAALAAVAVLEAVEPGSTDHVCFSAARDEQLVAIAAIGKSPLLGVWPGAGPGASNALAISLLSAACAMLSVKDRP